jgi:hypothetical protein
MSMVPDACKTNHWTTDYWFYSHKNSTQIWRVKNLSSVSINTSQARETTQTQTRVNPRKHRCNEKTKTHNFSAKQERCQLLAARLKVNPRTLTYTTCAHVRSGRRQHWEKSPINTKHHARGHERQATCWHGANTLPRFQVISCSNSRSCRPLSHSF